MGIKIVPVDLGQTTPPKQALVVLAQIMVQDIHKMRPDKVLTSSRERDDKRKSIEVQSARIRNYLNQAFQDNPNFIVFPELSIPWEMQDELHKIAVERGVYIVGGLTYSPDFYNPCAVFPPFKDLELPLQYKMNPWGEDKNVKAGPRRIYLFKNTGFGSFASVICYDFTRLDVPEALRQYDVNVIFWLTLNKRIHIFDSIAKSASENVYTYICLCNAAGSLSGNSAIYGPVYKTKEGLILTERHVIVRAPTVSEDTEKADLDIDGLVKSIIKAKAGEDVLRKRGFVTPPAELRKRELIMQAQACGIVTSLSQNKCRVLVIGDVMLDHVIYGRYAKFTEVLKHGLLKVYMQESTSLNQERPQIRPEGCSPEMFSPGGAAWLAMAISQVADVRLLGLLGSNRAQLQSTNSSTEPDYEGKRFIETLEDRVNFTPILTKEAPTICKNYFYHPPETADWQIPLYGKYAGIRVDREDSETMKKEVRESLEEVIIDTCNEAIKNQHPDAIVIDDYEKGMITQNVVEKIADSAADIPLFVDPKYDWKKFKDVEVQAFLPNAKELLYGLGYDDEEEIKKILNDKRGLTNGEFQKMIESFHLETLLNENLKELAVKADLHGSVVTLKEADGTPKQWFINPTDMNLQRTMITGVCCGGVYDSFYIASRVIGNDEIASAALANFAAGLRIRCILGKSPSLNEIKHKIEANLPYFEGVLESKEI